jgi:hypothetical protein
LKFLGWPIINNEETEKEEKDDPLRAGLYVTEQGKDMFACHYGGGTRPLENAIAYL